MWVVDTATQLDCRNVTDRRHIFASMWRLASACSAHVLEERQVQDRKSFSEHLCNFIFITIPSEPDHLAEMGSNLPCERSRLTSATGIG